MKKNDVFQKAFPHGFVMTARVNIRSAVCDMKQMRSELDFDAKDTQSIILGAKFFVYLNCVGNLLSAEYKQIQRSIQLWKSNDAKMNKILARLNSFDTVFLRHQIYTREFLASNMFTLLQVELIKMKEAQTTVEENENFVDFDSFLQTMKNEINVCRPQLST